MMKVSLLHTLHRKKELVFFIEFLQHLGIARCINNDLFEYGIVLKCFLRRLCHFFFYYYC